MAQTAAEFLAKRRAAAKQGGSRGSGRAGGRATGGGQSRSGQTAVVQPPPETGRFRKGGPLEMASRLVTNPDFVPNEAFGETSEGDIETGLETSPTEMGIRETREFEMSQFDQMMASKQAEAADTQQQLEEARRDVQRSREARSRTDPLFADPQQGGLNISMSTTRDPEMLREAELLNRRIARERRLAKQAERQQSELDMMIRAKETGRTVPEMKAQILADLDSLDARKRDIQEDINVLGRTEEDRSLFGTPLVPRQFEPLEDEEFQRAVREQIKLGLSRKDATDVVKKNLGRRERKGQFSAVGPRGEQLKQIDREKAALETLFSALPESDEMIPGVEPLSESPIEPPSVRESPQMTDDELLASFMTSPVDVNEPAGRNPNAVTNRIDPEMVKGVQREIRKGDTASRAVAAADTGR